MNNNLPALINTKNVTKEVIKVIHDNLIKDNEIYGNFVIGNMYNVEAPKVDSSALLRLIERSKILADTDQEYKDFLEELNSFLSDKSGRNIIGLEQKLLNGNRAELIEDAILLEGRFSRRLARDQYSRASQALFLHCLSKINGAFSAYIKPLIQSGAEKSVIDRMIYSHVIEPIYNEVTGADNSISIQMVQGMLYFLTGKCHIKWN